MNDNDDGKEKREMEVHYGSQWSEYRRLVLSNIEDNKERIDHIDITLQTITNRVTSIETKLTIYAAIGGFIGGFIPSIISHFFFK
jgi:hypothetical protein